MICRLLEIYRIIERALGLFYYPAFRVKGRLAQRLLEFQSKNEYTCRKEIRLAILVSEQEEKKWRFYLPHPE